jgi:RNA polymerase sigma-70 factor (ECF subfamily)
MLLLAITSRLSSWMRRIRGQRETDDRMTGPVSEAESDAVLARRAMHDRAAFAELYRRYLDRVYAYCRYRLPTREQAEDATSQIFLKALAALPNRRAEGAFVAWLFAIAHNVVTDAYRTRRVAAPLSAALGTPDRSPSPEEVATERDRTSRLLAILPPDQRRIMELRLVGLTGAEIAEALGKSLGAVKMAQKRALERMQTALDATEEAPHGREQRRHVHIG